MPKGACVTGEGGEFCEQLLEESLWQVLDGGGDCGLVGQDYLDCIVWVTVMYARSRMSGLSHSDVAFLRTACRIVALGGTFGCLEEEFDYSGDGLELDLQAMISSCKARP